MGQAAGNSRAFLRAAAFVVLLGRVRLQIPTADNRELCLEAPVPGVCPGSFDRWYYNRASQDCQRFTHGGCLGNENNFLSFDACIETCGKIKKVPVMCRVKPPQGTWSPLKPKYFFNLETMKCEEFFPKKRSRHPNMFSSKRSCTDVCKLGRSNYFFIQAIGLLSLIGGGGMKCSHVFPKLTLQGTRSSTTAVLGEPGDIVSNLNKTVNSADFFLRGSLLLL
ncbi:Tissue factor pathway inhibitor 2 [Podarcis lilfordi]|uniref:Tissue factor pathway inhibitor 2 n=1 Tax=Podarcis lilfordi TaxID=74358 RepID=A0AA35L2K4_9SAUR|nr:Tissue factor pathway inhibitor 2 [Podarcis lilfordi]